MLFGGVGGESPTNRLFIIIPAPHVGICSNMCGNKESVDAIPPSKARRQLPRTVSTSSAGTSYKTAISSALIVSPRRHAFRWRRRRESHQPPIHNYPCSSVGICSNMCGNKESVDPIPPSKARRQLPRTVSTSSAGTYKTAISYALTRFYPSSSNNNSTSITSLRDSPSENPHSYSFQELATATNNFVNRCISASSAAWRCSVRDKDVVVFQRRLRRSLPISELSRRLTILCKSHHAALAKLLGASLSGDYIYLVYEFVTGANLSDCLRNPKTPDYTVLGTWLSRMQIAEDVAHGIEYIHHSTGLDLFLVHNHIKSSTIVLTDPDLRAKICLFGAAELTGERADEPVGEIEEEGALRRTGSRTMKVEVTRGYIPPEIITGGNASQKSDVYAVGVVLLELLSGAEPLKYRFDNTTGDCERESLITIAAEAADDEGKLRLWIDRRLRDSYPVEVAKKVTRLALDCVHIEVDKRPDMRRVKEKISRRYLESKAWSDKMKIPTELSVSMTGR